MDAESRRLYCRAVTSPRRKRSTLGGGKVDFAPYKAEAWHTPCHFSLFLSMPRTACSCSRNVTLDVPPGFARDWPCGRLTPVILMATIALNVPQHSF